MNHEELAGHAAELSDKGEYSTALDIYLKILHDTTLNDLFRGYVHGAASALYFHLGNKAEGDIHALQAIERLQNSGEEEWLAKIRLRYGVWLREFSVEDSRKQLHESLKIAERLLNKTEIAKAHWELGNTCAKALEFEAAIKHFEIARETYLQLQDEDNTRKVDFFISRVLISLERHDEAEQRLFEVKQYAASKSMEYQHALVLQQLGHLYRTQQKFDKAESCYLESLRSKKAGMLRMDSLVQLGLNYRDLNNFPAATATLEEALSLARENNEKFMQAKVHAILAELYGLSDKNRLLSSFDAAKQIYLDLGKLDDIKRMLAGKSRFLKYLGHEADSKEAARELERFNQEHP